MVYKRQKLLLAILLEATSKITIDELAGAVAVLNSNSSTIAHQHLFDFVDTSKPRSLQLEKDVTTLVSNNLITTDGDRLDNKLSKEARAIAFEIPLDELAEIKKQLHVFWELTPNERIKKAQDVLALKPSTPASVETISIFTIGYEGDSIDSFFKKVLNAGLKAIIDIRKNPISRKYGFSKKALKALCSDIGLDYYHFPEVGIATDLRKNLKSNTDYETLFEKYEETTLETTTESQKEIIIALQKKPSVLLCFEADSHLCHRSRLASRLAKETHLQVRHL
ncbi:DUF488 family protein [Pseudodesulfovibrio methanolicus]|uniref:DUF488 domain-containing protein n=1 Tax=Pseudodesulfovibrio methanolicus TaxID=3126690 RepID=A0ABZ2IT83_9BACT